MADTDIFLAKDGTTSFHRWLYDAGGGLFSTHLVNHSTQAAVILDYEHNELHEGNHYFLAGTITLDSASSDFVDFGVVTPNTTTWANMTFSVSSVGQTTFTVYEGASYAASDGTAVTPINNNRNSANTSVLTIVTNPGYTAASSDQLFQQIIGVSGGAALIKGGLIERNKELILKQNTQYAFRIASSTAANQISYVAEWYEHADKV